MGWGLVETAEFSLFFLNKRFELFVWFFTLFLFHLIPNDKLKSMATNYDSKTKQNNARVIEGRLIPDIHVPNHSELLECLVHSTMISDVIWWQPVCALIAWRELNLTFSLYCAKMIETVSFMKLKDKQIHNCNLSAIFTRLNKWVKRQFRRRYESIWCIFLHQSRPKFVWSVAESTEDCRLVQINVV